MCWHSPLQTAQLRRCQGIRSGRRCHVWSHHSGWCWRGWFPWTKQALRLKMLNIMSFIKYFIKHSSNLPMYYCQIIKLKGATKHALVPRHEYNVGKNPFHAWIQLWYGMHTPCIMWIFVCESSYLHYVHSLHEATHLKHFHVWIRWFFLF